MDVRLCVSASVPVSVASHVCECEPACALYISACLSACLVLCALFSICVGVGVAATTFAAPFVCVCVSLSLSLSFSPPVFPNLCQTHRLPREPKIGECLKAFIKWQRIVAHALPTSARLGACHANRSGETVHKLPQSHRSGTPGL